MHSVALHTCVSEPTTKICMKIDPYYQQHKCSPVILVSSRISFMRIFAGVRGGCGRAALLAPGGGCALRALFTVRRYALLGICDRKSVCPPVCPSVCHTRGLEHTNQQTQQMRVGWSKMEIFASFARYIFRTFTSKATFIILYYVAH